MNPYIQEHITGYDQAMEHFKNELKHIRTGHASPELVEGIMVTAYDAQTPIQQLATITVPEPKTIQIQPWDKSILKEIEKAIVASNLGYSPVNDGSVVRVPMPPMSEENRKQLTKIVSQKTELARISLRQLRDKVKESVLNAEKDKQITEDDKFAYLKQLDEFNADKDKMLKELSQQKSDQIMKI